MIANADHGVVIRNDHGPDIPQFANEDHILRSRRPGPEGWCEAVMQILERYDQNTAPPAGSRHQDQEGTAPHG
ncbi:hypothetical protein HCZ87_19720, partial [Phaeobacter sp. HF9A]|nr:hypothetical protein [Phaeobacter sp. HF9A]